MKRWKDEKIRNTNVANLMVKERDKWLVLRKEDTPLISGAKAYG